MSGPGESFVFETRPRKRERKYATGPKSSFGDVAGATIDETFMVENLNARELAEMRAYSRQAKRIYETYGAELESPYHVTLEEQYPQGFNYSPHIPSQYEIDNQPGFYPAVDRRKKAWNAKIAELRAANPDKVIDLPPIEEETLRVQREAFQRSEEVSSRASGFLDRDVAGFVGGLVGGFSDPVNLATLPVGFGAKTIVGAVLKEALVNAGITGGVELARDKAAWKDITGREYTVEDLMSRVSTAAVLGGGLGGAGKFGQQGLGRVFFDRSAFEVFRTKYDALPADHPFRADETLKRAVDQVERSYADEDLNPGLDPEDHAARMARARTASAAPEAVRHAEPDEARAELQALLDRGASAEEIWKSKVAVEIENAGAETPTLRSGEPIPDGRLYLLPDPDSNAPRQAGLEDAVHYLAEQARMRAGPEGPLQDRRALFVMGYPGAGKSTFIQRFAERARAAVTDADEAKTVIPEYAGGRGSEIVQNESVALREEVLRELVVNGDNLIFETLGRDPNVMTEVAEELKARGYSVELVHVRVPFDEAVRRSWQRYLGTGRSIRPTMARGARDKPEATWQAVVDSGAFSHYIDIDYSGEKSAARAKEIPGGDAAGRRGGPRLEEDLQAGGRKEGGQSLYDLADEVRLIAEQAALAERQAPITPDAPYPSTMNPALARAGEDPTPENLDAAAEALEAELGDLRPDEVGADDVRFSLRKDDVAGANAEELRAAAVEAFGEGADKIFDVIPLPDWAPRNAKAFTNRKTGRVTLIDGKLRASEVKGVLLHEVGAHYGMRRIMGDERFTSLLFEVMDRVRAAKDSDPRWGEIHDSVMFEYGADSTWDVLAEEMLAAFLQRHPDLAVGESWWSKIVNGVKRWWRTVTGAKSNLTDADIVDLARSAVEARGRDGANGDVAGPDDAAFSRGGPPSAGGPAVAPPGFGQPKQGAGSAPGPVTPAEARARFLTAKTRTVRRKLGRQMARFLNGSGEPDAGEFLQAVLDYQGQGSGLELSVDGQRKVITAQSLAKIEAALNHFRAGLAGRRVNKADMSNFVKEMFGEDTKDPAAKALAGAVGPVLEELRQRFNRAGGQIGKLERYGLPQSHDVLALRRWIAANGGKAKGRHNLKLVLFDSLDIARMRDVHTGKPLTGQQVWDSLDSVIEDMLTDGWATRTPSGAPVSEGALAGRRADHRYLIFRDAATWMDWQERFGAGDPISAMVSHVEAMAKDISAMEILGPNPDGMIEWLKQVALKEGAKAELGQPARLPKRVAKRKDPQDWVRGKIKRMDDMWLNYTGLVNVPVNQTLARWSGAMRNLLTSSALGSAILSALPTDPVFQAFARNFTGTGHGQMLKQLVHQMKNPRHAAQMALILDHSLSTFGDDARFARGLSSPGFTSVIAGQVIAMQGLTPWTRGGRQVFGMGLLADLGNLSTDDFADLPPAFQRTFTRYGIDDAAWDAIRGAPLNADGFMQPSHVANSVGQELADRLLHMILQETEYAVPSGTLRSRSFMRGRDQAGTLMGEMRQSGRMFLSFGATLPMLYGYRLHHQLAGSWGSKAAGALYATAAIATLTIGGAIAMQLKSLAAGKDVQNPEDPKFWQAAFLQGGGFGVYGDFLFGDMNRMDRSLGETIGGAQLGFLSDVQEATIGEFAKGEKGDITTAVTQLAAKNVPGSNLWYLKLAYDRWIEDGLRHATDPDAEDGFRRRIQNQKKSTGQGFFWSPGSDAPSRGPVVAPVPAPSP